MFNDERINLVNGKVKRNSVLLIILVTFIWSIAKIISLAISKDLNYRCFILEIIVITISVFILLIKHLFVNSDIKDEMYISNKANYFNKIFTLYVIILFTVYAIFIGSTNIVYVYFPAENYLISFLIYTITLYTFCYLKQNNIYFHYKSIETNKFYKNVGINIGKIGILFCSMFFITCITFVLSHSELTNYILYFKSYALVYLLSIAALSIEYFFFSILEKIYFDGRKTEGISLAGIISYIISRVISISSQFFSCLAYLKLANIEGSTNDGVKLLIIGNYLGLVFILVRLIALIYIYHDLKVYTKTKKLLKVFYRFAIVFCIYNANFIIINGYLNVLSAYIVDMKNLQLIMTSLNYFNYALNLVSFILLLIMCLKNNYSKKIIIAIIATTITFRLLFIIFNSTTYSIFLNFSNAVISSILFILIVINNRKRKDIGSSDDFLE